MDKEIETRSTVEEPNKRITELEKSILQALRLEKDKIDMVSDNPIIASKSNAYHQLLGMADSRLRKDALSPNFDTVMAAKSAMVLAGMHYAFEKNNVGIIGSVGVEFAAGVTSQDKKLMNYVNSLFDAKEFPTCNAKFEKGTVSTEVVMQDMKTFFKDQFGIEFEKAMAARKLEDLQRRIG